MNFFFFHLGSGKPAMWRRPFNDLLGIGIMLSVTLSLLTGCSSENPAVETRPTSSPSIEDTAQPTTDIESLFPQTTAIQPTVFVSPESTQPSIPTTTFQHPLDFFTITYPETWSVEEQESLGTLIREPSGSAWVILNVMSTGYLMENQTILDMIEAREGNVFYKYDGFLEIDRQVDVNSGSYSFTKEFVEDQSSKVVVSYYKQSGEIIYIVDFWSNQDSYPMNSTIFKQIIETIEFNHLAVGEIDPISLIQYIPFENGVVAFEVPMHWIAQHTKNDLTMVDTFKSPDGHAVFQIIIYNDGNPVAKSVAGEFALNMLRDHYTKDIFFIDEDKTLGGRVEQLIWRSATERYQGTTLFETIDNFMIIFTAMYDYDFEVNYKPILDHIVDSYSVLVLSEG